MGLENHEALVLNPDSKDVLDAVMLMTEMPRIYLLGFSSIRIEDTVLVGRSGGEELTVGAYYLGSKVFTV